MRVRSRPAGKDAQRRCHFRHSKHLRHRPTRSGNVFNGLGTVMLCDFIVGMAQHARYGQRRVSWERPPVVWL
jgi:hypothetical protein